MIRKYAEIFCWKNVSSFCSAKATHIFSAKNIRILYIESAKIVNKMTLNKLVKLTTLWTTGPWCFTSISTLLKSHWDDRRVMMKGSVQWSTVNRVATLSQKQIPWLFSDVSLTKFYFSQTKSAENLTDFPSSCSRWKIRYTCKYTILINFSIFSSKVQCFQSHKMDKISATVHLILGQNQEIPWLFPDFLSIWKFPGHFAKFLDFSLTEEK